jgi:predicted NBD/HSP70 family sugar kinase
MPIHPHRPVSTGAARQHSLREQNLALVAHAVMSSPEPVSRAEVALRTGLTRATVSTLVDRFIAAGILAELPPLTTGGAGRPAVPLVPATRTVAGLGLQINPNYLAAALIDLSGAVVAESIKPGDYRGSDPATACAELRELAQLTLDSPDAVGMRVAGAYLAVPGLVEAETGILRVAPNLKWEQVPVVELLNIESLVLPPTPWSTDPDYAKTPLRLMVANDAKLAALAEVQAAGSDSFIYLACDQGIGGAIVVRGELYGGSHGWSGEMGHVIVDPSGPRCSCGAQGCLEVYASKAPLMIAAGLSARAPISELTQAIDDGVAAALVARDQAAKSLGTVLSDLINVFDLPTVIIGGELLELVPYIEEALTAQLNYRVLSAPYVTPEVKASSVGLYPSLVGAGREVLRRVIEDPALFL